MSWASPLTRATTTALRGVSRMESLEIVLEKSKTQYSQSEKEYMAEEKNRIYRRLLCRMGAAGPFRGSAHDA